VYLQVQNAADSNQSFGSADVDSLNVAAAAAVTFWVLGRRDR